MNATISLNDYTFRFAIKVGNKAEKNLLPPEFQSKKSSIP